ncbi:hypothetical protein T439DRAFT_281776, partial [Meredithblackwellia eburnea MCA 4105]
FETVSRMNHSCTPNTSYFFDSTTVSGKIHSIKYIKRGEELTLSYLSPLDSFDFRQRRLREDYAFKCIC